jgi:hypothetical protein
MDCPCELCIVRPICGTRLVQKPKWNKYFYLILEYAEECPYILDYFGRNLTGRVNHDYDLIYKLCELFGAHKGNYFVWQANELGIYKG